MNTANVLCHTTVSHDQSTKGIRLGYEKAGDMGCGQFYLCLGNNKNDKKR